METANSLTTTRFQICFSNPPLCCPFPRHFPLQPNCLFFPFILLFTPYTSFVSLSPPPFPFCFHPPYCLSVPFLPFPLTRHFFRSLNTCTFSSPSPPLRASPPLQDILTRCLPHQAQTWVEEWEEKERWGWYLLLSHQSPSHTIPSASCIIQLITLTYFNPTPYDHTHHLQEDMEEEEKEKEKNKNKEDAYK